ncbi:MAG: hypothetical protein L0228_20070 [Planctomycetes bacterium]|nr:hypothetical protein [Planctomycetota bacterium]
MARVSSDEHQGEFGVGVLPCPQPSAAAVDAGVFGFDERGVIIPSIDDVRSMTEEHARELLGLTLDGIHLQRCWLLGADPMSGKVPRGDARRSALKERLAREAERLERRYQDMLAAYAEGFGWPAAEALHQFVKANAQDTTPAAPPLVQQEMF